MPYGGESACYPVGLNGKHRANSTLVLKQVNSLDMDRSELRRTRSADYMNTTPTIVIHKVKVMNDHLHSVCTMGYNLFSKETKILASASYF